MTRIIERQEFHGFYDQNSKRVFSDLEFKYCKFWGSAISITYNPKRRSIVRNVRLIHCEQGGCAVETAIVEDVTVDGLRTHGLLHTWGAVYKHVVLKGNIDNIMISPVIATGTATPKQQRAFDEANGRYYETVDWALDISEGRFDECEIQRVPARLIRRDPETQVVITREKALMGEWKKLDLSKTYWRTSIEFFLERGDQDLVLVAPKRYSKYQVLLDGLKMLRDAGVAEPD